MKLQSIAAGILLMASSSAFASSGMSCFVDTPDFDQFTSGYCFAVIWGVNQSTAVFRVDNPPANAHIHWDHPSCPSSTTFCSVPIQAFQFLTVSALVIDLDSSYHNTVQATANFENGM